jgi:hypothetical protein
MDTLHRLKTRPHWLKSPFFADVPPGTSFSSANAATANIDFLRKWIYDLLVFIDRQSTIIYAMLVRDCGFTNVHKAAHSMQAK